MVEVASVDLWFTEEDQIRFIVGDKVLEGKNVAAETFNIPGDCTESCRVHGAMSIT